MWAFQPVRRPEVPAVRDAAGRVTGSIGSSWRGSKRPGCGPRLRPIGATLIAPTFDLTGLPPTPEEVDVFLEDDAPDAYERAVDRLLASPHYGERWGRHWLDLVRYADTSGCNGDFPMPEAYRYRNYVVVSFNRDKPYNVFLQEQIAGDLLPAGSEEDRRDSPTPCRR